MEGIKTKLIRYNDFEKFVVYDNVVYYHPPQCNLHLQYACSICFSRKYINFIHRTSLVRSRSTILGIALSNKFELFVTFTFNPALIDSYDYDLVKIKFSKWLNNFRRKSPNLKYLIVPELHKSGRIHFHGLFANYEGKLVNSGRSKNNKIIYNLDDYSLGFTTATYIDNSIATSHYLTKYITKELIKQGNKKRFWTSRGLSRPSPIFNIPPAYATDAQFLIKTTYRHKFSRIYELLSLADIPTVDEFPSPS